MRILVTRAPEDAPALSDALRARGWAPVEVPLLQRVFMLDALAQAWHPPSDLLVVTSPAAADAVARRPPPEGRFPPVAAVGPATAARARAHGMHVIRVPEQATGRDLAHALGNLHEKRVLYPRAEHPTPGTAEALRRAGAELVEVTCYRNEAPPDAVPNLRAAWPVDLATLMSASAARRLATALQEAHLDPCPTVVIGPSTAAAARQAGLPVAAQARPHTLEGLVEAIAGLLS